ncbi:hypothetical protein SAMN05444398_101270 [Roseovarius pacificus]|uniref:Uncharacterized protein n=1 Tax=Roseovarius pacificus TaxID=337701 RepID=A0A1M6X3U9_9RHOB|nr:hypothetical protein [Roseovarius pacificus]GGO52598.1 hypothetical protein GCM10011315_08510 [Roseovarius pacificus]SHL00603.1 hypothetical protein SAMN05444398_101270 [Roseovarius pacificus]
MNVNQLVNMFVRIVVRRLMNGGVNAGINAVSKRKARGETDTPEQTRAQGPDSKKTQQRARQAMRITRRFGKF